MDDTDTRPRLAFLWFEGCPLADAQRAELDAALERFPPALRPEVQSVDLMAEDTPERLRVWGSPTILVDGRDITGAGPGDACGCRVYDTPEKVVSAEDIGTILDERMQGAPVGPRRSWGWLALFAGGTTLVCCALPILLVALGFGAAVAALVQAVPGLVFLSQHKGWTLAIAAVVLAAAWLMHRRASACPADPELAAACERSRRWNRYVLITASAFWTVGFATAYLALPVVRWLDGMG